MCEREIEFPQRAEERERETGGGNVCGQQSGNTLERVNRVRLVCVHVCVCLWVCKRSRQSCAVPYAVPASRLLTPSLSDDEDSVAVCDGDALRNSPRSRTSSGRKSSAAPSSVAEIHTRTHAASVT